MTRTYLFEILTAENETKFIRIRAKTIVQARKEFQLIKNKIPSGWCLTAVYWERGS